MAAQRDFTMARSFLGLFHAIVVEAFRSGCSRAFVFVLAFVFVSAFSVAARADQQPAGSDDVVLAPDVTKWSSELKGGQWGWDLKKYGHLEWFFQIGGKTLIMLSTGSNTTDNIFILDADPINAELSASPRVEDAWFRYEVILKKIEELKAGGL